MPIYEFFCKKCHHEFEELVFGADMPQCPHCGAAESQKLMSKPCLHSGQADAGPSFGQGLSQSSSSKCSGCSGGNCANC